MTRENSRAGMFAMSLSSAVGHMLLLNAYAHHAGDVTPFLYSWVGFAMLAGWLVYRHVPDAWSMAGIPRPFVIAAQ